MILIEAPDGSERCLVESLDGYEGWTVVSEQADEPPHADCHWCCDANQWVSDDGACARREKLEAIRDPEKLLEIIENLQAEIALLKGEA